MNEKKRNLLSIKACRVTQTPIKRGNFLWSTKRKGIKLVKQLMSMARFAIASDEISNEG